MWLASLTWLLSRGYSYWLSSSSGTCLVVTLVILIEHGLVSCRGNLGVFWGDSLVLHVTLSHGYRYWFALLVPVYWVRKLGDLLTYDDCLCSSGRHHALSE